MQRISNPKSLRSGDVLMCSRYMPACGHHSAYTWRFLGIVLTSARSYLTKVHRIGREEPMMLRNDDRWELDLLDEDEWPDGVWQTRTRLILEGVVDLSE
jgi:hypothetical protein